jgi:multisubunit Na+/H+ antiporter MnhB subunit
MNKTQRAILIVGAAIILVMLLFPPWSRFGIANDYSVGYYFVSGPGGGSHVNTSLLLLQIFGVGLATALIFIAAKSKSN